MQEFGMARRPDSKPEDTNLARLSVNAVRRFYDRAHEDCRIAEPNADIGAGVEAIVEVAVTALLGCDTGRLGELARDKGRADPHHQSNKTNDRSSVHRVEYREHYKGSYKE